MARRTPNLLKIIQGTAKPGDEPRGAKQVDVDLPGLASLPHPPDWLDVDGQALYRKAGPILVANRLLTDLSFDPFTHLCALHGKLVKLWKAGEMPPGYVVAQYRLLLVEFGMTPASQNRVGAGMLGGRPTKEAAPAPSVGSGNRFGNNGRPGA